MATHVGGRAAFHTTVGQPSLSTSKLLPPSSLLCMFATQSCPTVCDLMDYSPPGSSVHGILQARILEWVVMTSSRDYWMSEAQFSYFGDPSTSAAPLKDQAEVVLPRKGAIFGRIAVMPRKDKLVSHLQTLSALMRHLHTASLGPDSLALYTKALVINLGCR